MSPTISDAAREPALALACPAVPAPRGSRAGSPTRRRPRAVRLGLLAVVLALVLIAGMGGIQFGGLQASPLLGLSTHRQSSEPGPAQFGGDVRPYGTAQAGPVRMLYVGASVTRGWYVTSLDDAYPAIASRTIAQAEGRDVEWHVVALPGATARVIRTWHFPSHEDIVVVHSVTNDFLFDTPLAQFKRDYLALLQELRGSSPRAAFVCLGEWDQAGRPNRSRVLGYAYDQVVHQACTRSHGVYVPLSQDFQTPGAHGRPGHPSIFGPARDSFHPDDYGDRLIAQSVVAGIEGDPPIEEPPS